MSINYNIVRFNGQAIELESPWKVTVGLHPDCNRATCTAAVFSAIQVGTAGSVTFSFSSAGGADVTLANITCIDAEPVDFAGPAGVGVIVKYRLVFMDARYGFVEPRGGRLALGLINPSTQIPPDADRSNIPMSRTMTECLQACINEMGISASIPDVSAVDPPKDLKWFGSHAPSELAKLLTLCDLIFCMQMDGTYNLKKRNGGSDPTIPPGLQLPTAVISGADARGKRVIFASYPTQVVNTITEDDLDDGDLTAVFNNSSGAWQGIDATGAYAGNTSSGAAIAEMNNHFQSTKDPAAQSGCYRFMRLDPDKFDPVNSPILRKTYPAAGTSGDSGGGPDSSDPNGLPDQINISLKASIATQDPVSKLWTNQTYVDVPIDRICDGNVISTHHRLVKLPSTVTSTADLEGNCESIDFDNDIKIRLSVGSSSWDGSNQLYTPEYFLLGFSGTPDSPSMISSDQCAGLLNDPGTLVVPIAELVAMRYGTDSTSDPTNLSDLQSQLQAIAPRYLSDPSNPPKQFSGAGFFAFTFDGTLSEVEIDQKALVTRLKTNCQFRPASGSLREEFHKIKHPKESHPHEAKTAGSRAAAGSAGSSAPVQPVANYVPIPGPPAYYLFACSVHQSNGSSGNASSPSTYTYTMFSLFDGTQIYPWFPAKTAPSGARSDFDVEAPRFSSGSGGAAGYGLAYYDKTGAPKLLAVYETMASTPCANNSGGSTS